MESIDNCRFSKKSINKRRIRVLLRWSASSFIRFILIIWQCNKYTASISDQEQKQKISPVFIWYSFQPLLHDSAVVVVLVAVTVWQVSFWFMLPLASHHSQTLLPLWLVSFYVVRLSITEWFLSLSEAQSIFARCSRRHNQVPAG